MKSRMWNVGTVVCCAVTIEDRSVEYAASSTLSSILACHMWTLFMFWLVECRGTDRYCDVSKLGIHQKLVSTTVTPPSEKNSG